MGILTRLGRAFGSDDAAPRRAVVASAERFRIDNKDEVTRLKTKQRDWQVRARGYFDEVPEVKYGVNKLGDAMSKLRLVAAYQEDPGEDPMPVADALEAGLITDTEAANAMDAVRRLNLGIGHGEIMRRLGVHLSVPGECYLVGLARTPTEDERWEIRSTTEVTVDAAGKVQLSESEDNRTKRELTPNDLIVRIWLPHMDKAAMPDSPLRSVLNVCEELLILDRMARGTERSRNNAGLLLIPEELDEGGAGDPTDGDNTDGADETLEQKILRSMTTAIGDEGSAAAVVPHIIYGKGDLLDKVRHIDLNRTLDAWVETRQSTCRVRLAAGINLPAEVILGMADVNHWTAWQIEDSTFKAHVEPLTIVALQGLTSNYYRPMLRTMGTAEPSRFLIWYDASGLVAQPNRGADAKDLYDRFELSGDTLRESTNFGEEDAPDEAEIARRLEIENAKRPVLQGLPQGDERRPEPAPEDQGPPASDEPEDGEQPDGENATQRATLTAERVRRQLAERRLAVITAAAPRSNRTEHGARLRGIDAQYRARVTAGLDASMRRALERAGNRLSSRVKASRDATLRELIAGKSPIEVAATLGPQITRTLGESEETLLAGAFEDVRDRFNRWTEQAQRQALAVVPKLSDAARAGAEHLQRDDLNAAWDAANDGLHAQAAERLFSLEVPTPIRGEFDPSTLVPARLVRQIAGLAGGAIREQGNADPLTLANGLLIGRLLEESGIQTDGWAWRYGDFPRENPFEPHQDLDGLEFASWTDERLANLEGWPPEPYYQPGDHEGCVCDWERVTLQK